MVTGIKHGDMITSLTDPNDSIASTTAQAHRDQLLSEMFPRRTVAIGGNRIPVYNDDNIDMQSKMHVDWP